MIRRLAALLLAVFVLPATALAEGNCPVLDRPAGKLQWVAENTVVNGLPLQILRFDGKQSPQEVLAFYRQLWQRGAPPIEYTSGPWQVIAAARSECFYTVQVQAAGGGVTGYLAASSKPAGKAVRPADKVLPLLPGSQIVNDIEHRDPGKSARTVVAASKASPGANADFYRRRLADAGWTLVTDSEPSMRKSQGVVMTWKQGLAELNLVIGQRQGMTTIVANFEDKP